MVVASAKVAPGGEPIRLLHAADVHLGASFSAFGSHAAERRAAQLEAFRRLPGLAASEGAHAVVIAGDLFDGAAPPAEAVAVVRETSRRLVSAGRPVFVVPGNHDAPTLRSSPYREPLGGAHVFTSASFGDPVSVATSAGELHIYGIAFDRAREPEPLAGFRRAAGHGVHVVLLHGSVPDSPHWRSSPNALRLPLETLAHIDADYIALGDFHRFRPPTGFDEAGGIPACYSGSFAALDYTETGARGVVIAELRAGGAPQVRHLDTGLPRVEPLHDFDVGGFGDIAQLVEAIGSRLGEDVMPDVRLVGSPAFPLDAERLRIELAERYRAAAVEDATTFFASARLDELAEQDTVAGHVVRLGRARIEASADPAGRRAAEQALVVALAALGVR